MLRRSFKRPPALVHLRGELRQLKQCQIQRAHLTFVAGRLGFPQVSANVVRRFPNAFLQQSDKLVGALDGFKGLV